MQYKENQNNTRSFHKEIFTVLYMQFALAITEVTHSNKYSIYCLMIRKKDINFLLVFTLCKQKNHQMISLKTFLY